MFSILYGNNLRAFLICLGVAILLWLFNALGKERTESIDYPIEFEYDHQRYIEVIPLPKFVTFSVTGNGWQVLRKYLGISLRPVRYKIERPVNRNRPYILGSQLRRNITKVLQGTRLVEIITDTVAIKMDYRSERTIDLQIDSVKVPLAEGYRIISPIKIEPNLAVFKGPQSLIQDLPQPFFLKINQNEINQNFDEIIPINLENNERNLVDIDVQSIRVNFDVARYINRKSRMIIDKVNFPKGSKFHLASSRRQINVSYAFQAQYGGAIQLTDFRIVADFKTFNPKDSTVALKMTRKPKHVDKKDIKLPKRVKLSYRKN